MEEKVFCKTSAQIEILRKRNLTIVDEDAAAKILRAENYYNLINGYKDLFLKEKEPKQSLDVYLDNATFDELYSLYIFDRELRAIFIKYILIIENNIKSVLAHVVSCIGVNGHRDYLRIENFDCKSCGFSDSSHDENEITESEGKHNEQARKRDQRDRTGSVVDLISDIQREIAHQLKRNNSMIEHYMLDFGYIPLWVLVNKLSFGTISQYYAYLKQKEQNQIARQFGVRPDELESFLNVLTIFRNACAHDERFFSLRTKLVDHKPNSIKDIQIHHDLQIKKNSSGNCKCGKNDLFAVLIILKCLLPDEIFLEFFEQVNCALVKLEGALHSITIDVVTKKMGFPTNWTEIKTLSSPKRWIPDQD